MQTWLKELQRRRKQVRKFGIKKYPSLEKPSFGEQEPQRGEWFFHFCGLVQFFLPTPDNKVNLCGHSKARGFHSENFSEVSQLTDASEQGNSEYTFKFDISEGSDVCDNFSYDSEERTLKVFDMDSTDGTREDDLYGLIKLRFQCMKSDAQKEKHSMYCWYHPDKCQQRAEQERIQDPNYVYPQSERDKATKKFGWMLNALTILEYPMLRTFWNFHLTRCRGLAKWFC